MFVIFVVKKDIMKQMAEEKCAVVMLCSTSTLLNEIKSSQYITIKLEDTSEITEFYWLVRTKYKYSRKFFFKDSIIVHSVI